jgi:hypothetical protein
MCICAADWGEERRAVSHPLQRAHSLAEESQQMAITSHTKNQIKYIDLKDKS